MTDDPRWLIDLAQSWSLTDEETGALVIEWRKFRRERYGLLDERNELLAIGKDAKKAEWLLNMGLIGEREVQISRAMNAGCAFVDFSRVQIDGNALRAIPKNLARKICAMPIKKDGPNIWVAFADLPTAAVVLRLYEVSRCRIIPTLAVRKEIEDALVRYYPE